MCGVVKETKDLPDDEEMQDVDGATLLSDLRQSFSRMQKSLELESTQTDQMSRRLKKLEGKTVAGLKQAVGDHNRRVATAERTISQLLYNIEDLQVAIAQLQENNDALRVEMDAFKERRGPVVTSVVHHQGKRLLELERRLDALEQHQRGYPPF